jgi:hypothetical protein
MGHGIGAVSFIKNRQPIGDQIHPFFLADSSKQPTAVDQAVKDAIKLHTVTYVASGNKKQYFMVCPSKTSIWSNLWQRIKNLILFLICCGSAKTTDSTHPT